ncbi:multiple ankyrin repeats single kh domain protein [Rutstroemia sp. NJR-2017a WRK4]|nr:multiple ankyrin repeats single kh domain protein [Rutstroemia sp. NJR-2017a WRK4]
MGLAWETHRDLLKELWIAQDKTYDEVGTGMRRLHNFNATKNQYTAQFKKWGWRKNISNAEWRLINQSIIRRREDLNIESEVYLNNLKIPDARIRKEISRHILPTFRSTPASTATTALVSQDIEIRTPPPISSLDVPVILENFPTAPSSMVQMKRKRSTQHDTDLLPSKQIFKSGERESTIETLLGPPHFSAALRLLEVVVYLYSNAYLNSRVSNRILGWVVDAVPFRNLSIILRTKMPTLQPFQNELLLHGIRTGNTLFVKNLLQLGTELQYWIHLSYIPLQEALKIRNFEMVKIILDICPKTASHYYNIPGQYVERGLSAQIAQLLVGAGVNIFCTEYSHTGDTRADKRLNLLVIAIGRGDIALAQYLISIGADVNLGYKRGDAEYYLTTPLRVAVNTDRVDFVRLLLENNADVHAVCKSGYYEYCPYSSRHPITCKPRAYNDFTATALQAAASNGNIDIVVSLLKAGSNVNEPAHGNDGQTALYAATNAGKTSVAKLLVQSGANVDSPGSHFAGFPRPALLVAIENNDGILAEFLINSGANPNVPAFGYHGTTLLEAARNSNADERIASLLLAKGAKDSIGLNDPARNSFMRFKLLQAISKSDSERVHFLVKSGAEVDMEMMDVHQLENFSSPHNCHWHPKPTIKVTMLHLAIATKGVELSLFKYLLNHTKKGELDRLDYNGGLQPPLNHAVSWQRAEFVDALLDAGVDINAISPHWETERSLFLSEPGPTALYIASVLGDVDIVSLLLDRGADINLRLPIASTPLQVSIQPKHYYISKPHFDVSELLLSRSADINAPPATPVGYTALQAAVRALDFIDVNNDSARIFDLVQRLLSLGAMVNDRSARWLGRTALQYATELGHMNMVLLLLDHGADVNVPAAEEFGGTSIQYAAGAGNVKIVQVLIERGAEVNAPGSLVGGATALVFAARAGHIKVVQLLLESGAEVNSPNIGSPALDVAAMSGRLDVAQILIDAGADHNLHMAERYVSALEHARKHAQTGLILLLQKYRARLVPSREDRFR